MKLKRIFVNEETLQGLWTVVYPEVGVAEFSRLIDKWRDIEYITEYLESNEKHLDNEYFKPLDFDALIDKVSFEAKTLFNYFKTFTNESFYGGKKLESIFKALIRKERETGVIYELQSWKYRREEKAFPKSILRLYALRIKPNTFIITGGAIKVVDQMDKHPDLIKEKLKIQRVKDFLKENNVEDAETFECYINEI